MALADVEHVRARPAAFVDSLSMSRKVKNFGLCRVWVFPVVLQESPFR